MNFNFFQPISKALFEETFESGQIGYSIANQSTSDFDSANVVLIGIEDDRYGISCSSIRRSLYKYYHGKQFPKLYDLGNIAMYHDIDKDSFGEIIAECLERNLTICFIGGSQEFLIEIQQAYSFAKKYMNIGLVSSHFEINEDEEPENTRKNYLFRICAAKPSYLFNFVQIGYQKYLVNPKSVSLLKEMNFDEMRLGNLRDNIQQCEPLIRDLDILSISCQSLKQSETGGQPECSPNGLYAEELAQISKYAGASEKLSTISFSDYDSLYDANGACAQLISQSIWCFLEGHATRQNEFPELGSNAFTKYTVHNNEMNLDLVFIKSEKTSRWWVQMPEDKALLKKLFYLPCMYEDYETALDGDIPERWLRGFRKLSGSTI